MSRIPWHRPIDKETVKPLIANVVIKSNAVVEAYVVIAVTINKSASVIPTPSIYRQKGVEEQLNNPNAGEKNTYGKKLGQRKHKRKTLPNWLSF